ncbi:hypothetical protein Cgig2_009486 [Carnegiea gigantea]|uniref:PRA1 family protein n=1 Tax=Carnegiea gigantea TaxID=171969 RepID=A0A9Q1GV55_9CARY|nr:hypothetical protein Cgig2_009486 [Carnegiea gigantea]
MPCLNISTNVNLDGVDTSAILAEASSTVAKIIGKPEASGLRALVNKGSVPMAFGGTEQPAAYGELVSIGGLNPDTNKKLSAAIAAILETKLSVPKSRYFLKFYDTKSPSPNPPPSHPPPHPPHPRHNPPRFAPSSAASTTKSKTGSRSAAPGLNSSTVPPSPNPIPSPTQPPASGRTTPTSGSFSDKETLGLLVIVSVFVIFLTSVGSLLMSALVIGVAIVCVHGAFRVPEDLFLDDQEPGGAATGFLSFLGGATKNVAAGAATSVGPRI